MYAKDMEKSHNNTVDDHVVPSGGVPGKFRIDLLLLIILLSVFTK